MEGVRQFRCDIQHGDFWIPCTAGQRRETEKKTGKNIAALLRFHCHCNQYLVPSRIPVAVCSVLYHRTSLSKTLRATTEDKRADINISDSVFCSVPWNISQ